MNNIDEVDDAYRGDSTHDSCDNDDIVNIRFYKNSNDDAYIDEYRMEFSKTTVPSVAPNFQC